jgi:hypothetical protein
MLSRQLTTGHQSFQFVKFFLCIIVAQLARNGRTNHWMKPSLPVPRIIYQIAESGRRVQKEDIQDGDRPLRLPQMFWNRSSGCHVSFILLIQSTCIHYNSMPWQYEFQRILIHYKRRSKLDYKTKRYGHCSLIYFIIIRSCDLLGCFKVMSWNQHDNHLWTNPVYFILVAVHCWYRNIYGKALIGRHQCITNSEKENNAMFSRSIKFKHRQWGHHSFVKKEVFLTWMSY